MQRRGALMVLAVLSVVAAGCRSDNADRSSGEETPTTEVDSAVEGGFGDLESPCGEGNAAGATDQGVTDDAIRIGTMADATATAQPGLNQELWDASEAFVAWCNDQGGIDGRTIEYTPYESKLFEAQQRTIDACETEFMLVGGGAAFDNDVATERVACGLPDLPAFNATKSATEADLNFPAVPLPFEEHAAGEAFYLADQYPDAVAAAGMLTPNFPTATNLAARGRMAYEAAGWNFVDEQLYNPAGEANWTGLVASFRSAGVDALVYFGTREPLAAFLQSAAEQNWKPTVLIGTSSILTNDFVTEAGSAADGVYSYAAIEPFTEAEDGSALAMYRELLEKYAGGAEPAHLGVNSMSAWLLWATAAKACGSELTRDCVADQISGIHEWTGGGLHAPTDPGSGRGAPCFVLERVEAGNWVRVHPDEGFDCDPSYVVPTPAEYR